jgi:hypothetical protein
LLALGVGEQTLGLFPFAGGVERVGPGRAAQRHVKFFAALIGAGHCLFRRCHSGCDFANE